MDCHGDFVLKVSQAIVKQEQTTDFVQRPASVKFENVFRISEVRVKRVKIAIKPWIPPQIEIWIGSHLIKFWNNGNNEGHET